MTILLAFLGALGVWLVFTSLTHQFVARLGATHESLADASARTRMETNVRVQAFADVPFLDRALRPLLEPAASLLARVLRRAEIDEERIAQAGHPKRYSTVYDFYGWKALCAVTLFIVGLVNAIISGVGFLPIAFGLGILGLYLPDYHLTQLIRKRREVVRTEMAFVLHRLVIHIASSDTIDKAIEAIVQEPGGAFIQELRSVTEDFTHYTLEQAMRNLVSRNPGMDDIRRFAELVIRAKQLGQPLSEPLKNMANTMQSQIENEVESRGLATSVKMILPIGILVLPAIGIVVMGPAVYLAAQYFFR